VAELCESVKVLAWMGQQSRREEGYTGTNRRWTTRHVEVVLYVPDLGSDRVWLVKRDGDSGLKIEGYLQAPAGSGPRHAVLSIDGSSRCIPPLGVTADPSIFSPESPSLLTSQTRSLPRSGTYNTPFSPSTI
jgi:hypothetical protein